MVDNAVYFLRCHYGKILTLAVCVALTIVAFIFLGLVGAMIGAVLTSAIAKYMITTS